MIKKIIDGVIYRLKGEWGVINRLFYPEPYVMSTKQSLMLILEKKCSVARFGDGEFNIMRGGAIGFQKSDSSLADKLNQVIHEEVNGLQIGIPDVFGTLSLYSKDSAKFWKAYMGMHRGEIVSRLELGRQYVNTNMTRFWTGYKNKNDVYEIIELYKKVWKDRNVVFIEGELTRMGVGNDLFAGATSIRRILCPAKNAWNWYDKILATILSLGLDKSSLFILALGPTATVLAFDLAKKGYQALDLGHLDIQYEYSLKHAVGKIAIEGKYVNENIEGREVSDSIVDDGYMESIVARIGL